eukprot:1407911-Prymnesium_polylepis.3
MILLLSADRSEIAYYATPLGRATEFLSGDYVAERASLWEPLEMCRKLALTGVGDLASTHAPSPSPGRYSVLIL